MTPSGAPTFSLHPRGGCVDFILGYKSAAEQWLRGIASVGLFDFQIAPVTKFPIPVIGDVLEPKGNLFPGKLR
jgi:hypothetical protein